MSKAVIDAMVYISGFAISCFTLIALYRAYKKEDKDKDEKQKVEYASKLDMDKILGEVSEIKIAFSGLKAKVEGIDEVKKDVDKVEGRLNELIKDLFKILK